MKKLLLLFVCAASFSVIAQPAGLVGETFRLEYLELQGETYYTPNGEDSSLLISESNGALSLDATGIQNGLNAAASFSGNTLTMQGPAVTLLQCTEANCYYEDLYFYSFLTSPTLEARTFTYFYNVAGDGTKYLSLRFGTNRWAYFSTRPAPVADPLLFQTWYLYEKEADLSPPVYYNGPNPPQITINPDFTFTGIEGCALISGDFIVGHEDHLNNFYDFKLQSRNYTQDESNCAPGTAGYSLYELNYDTPLGVMLYEGSDGIDGFSYETFPGFVSHFRNVLILDTPENELAQVAIYPNPATDILLVQSTIALFESISILDINGRLMYSEADVTSKEISVSSLQSGLYFLQLKSENGTATKKFIKK